MSSVTNVPCRFTVAVFLAALCLAVISTALSAETYVLAVGISDYNDEDIIDLPLIAGEAARFLEVLETECGVDPDNTELIEDADAELDAIRVKISQIGRACTSDDLFIFYFTGHGATAMDINRDELDGDGVDEALLPVNAELHVDETYITDDLFGGWVSTYIPCDRILVIVDSCHSGGQGKSVPPPPTDGKNMDPISKDIFTDPNVRLSTASEILSACLPSERAYIEEAFSGSVFTHYLLQGLGADGGVVDVDQNGLIDAGEVFAYTSEAVSEFSLANPQKAQTPQYEPHAGTPPIVIGSAVAGFTDPLLLDVVCRELNRDAEQPLCKWELLDLTTLNISGEGITSLQGLQYAVNLVELDASDNAITDLSPLVSLSHLESLNLENNEISDLSPLLNAIDLPDNLRILLAGNPLDEHNAQIQELTSRDGITLEFIPRFRVLFLVSEDPVDGLGAAIESMAADFHLQVDRDETLPDDLADYGGIVAARYDATAGDADALATYIATGGSVVLLGESPYLLSGSQDLSSISPWLGALRYDYAGVGQLARSLWDFPFGTPLPRGTILAEALTESHIFPVCLSPLSSTEVVAAIEDSEPTACYAFRNEAGDGRVYYQSTIYGVVGPEEKARALLSGGLAWAFQLDTSTSTPYAAKGALAQQAVDYSIVASDGESCEHIALTWPADPSAESYDLLRADAYAGSYTAIARGILNLNRETIEWNDYNVDACTLYWYRVRLHEENRVSESAVDSGWRSSCSSTCEELDPSALLQDDFSEGIDETVWSYVHPPEHRASAPDGELRIDALNDWTQGSGVVAISEFPIGTTIEFDFVLEDLLCVNGGQSLVRLRGGGDLHPEYGTPTGQQYFSLYAGCDRQLYAHTESAGFVSLGEWEPGNWRHIRLDVNGDAIVATYEGVVTEVVSNVDTYRLWFGGHVHQAVYDDVSVRITDLAHRQDTPLDTEVPLAPRLETDDILFALSEEESYLFYDCVGVNGVVLPTDTDIVRLEWDWGDGVVTEDWFPSYHCYPRAGTYQLAVTAYGADGNSWTVGFTLEIENEIQEYHKDFTAPTTTWYSDDAIGWQSDGYYQFSQPDPWTIQYVHSPAQIGRFLGGFEMEAVGSAAETDDVCGFGVVLEFASGDWYLFYVTDDGKAGVNGVVDGSYQRLVEGFDTPAVERAPGGNRVRVFGGSDRALFEVNGIVLTSLALPDDEIVNGGVGVESFSTPVDVRFYSFALRSGLPDSDTSIIWSGERDLTLDATQIGESLEIDLDDDGIPDAGFLVVESAAVALTLSEYRNSGFMFAGQISTPTRIAHGDLLGAGRTYAAGDPAYITGDVTCGWQAGEIGYIGFRFRDPAGSVHYGWMHVEADADGEHVVVTDWAYKIDEGQPLSAGDGRQ